jgi:hypothetical protein
VAFDTVIVGSVKFDTVQWFRKKPIAVQAVRWDGKNVAQVLAFAGDAAQVGLDAMEPPALYLGTLENKRFLADVGDWIIRGVKGEFYACKPDIFEETYEALQARTPPIANEATGAASARPA